MVGTWPWPAAGSTPRRCGHSHPRDAAQHPQPPASARAGPGQGGALPPGSPRLVRGDPQLAGDPGRRSPGEAVSEAPPVVALVPHPGLCALAGLGADAPRPTVVVGGEGADELCGSAMAFPDWVRHTGLGALILGWRRLPSGLSDLPRWARHRWSWTRRPPLPLPAAERLAGAVGDEIREEYAEWRQRQAESLAANLDRPDKGGWDLGQDTIAWSTPLPEGLERVVSAERWPAPGGQVPWREAAALVPLAVSARSLTTLRPAK